VRQVLVSLRLNLLRIVGFLAFGLPDQKGAGGFTATEFMPNGMLDDAIKTRLDIRLFASFGPTEWSKALFGIAVTMVEMHRRGVIHCNLEPDKVFLNDQREVSNRLFP
jgi:serine/threonine protein kinase